MSDEERVRAAKLIESVHGQLVKWRTWFPNEESIVDVPRADLLALIAVAEEAGKLRDTVFEGRTRMVKIAIAFLRECQQDTASSDLVVAAKVAAVARLTRLLVEEACAK